MPRVVHFEIPAENPDRAAASTKRPSAEIEKWPGPMEYWMVTPVRRRAASMAADEERECLKHDQHHRSGVGGQCHRGCHRRRRQADHAEDSNSTVGYFAYCQDTEGNLFGVMQSDPTAK